MHPVLWVVQPAAAICLCYVSLKKYSSGQVEMSSRQVKICHSSSLTIGPKFL